MRTYYDTRAPEYDEWYLGRGVFARRERPGWNEDLAALLDAIAALAPARTLDVACGTAFLTQHLRGEVTALDQSERMLALAAARLPGATVVQADALQLPFEDDSFDRVFTGHFYGHLEAPEREAFVDTPAARLTVAPVVLSEPTTSRGKSGSFRPLASSMIIVWVWTSSLR